MSYYRDGEDPELHALKEALEAMYFAFGENFPPGENTAVDMARAALRIEYKKPDWLK